MRTIYTFALSMLFSSILMAQTPKTILAQPNDYFDYIGKLGNKIVTISRDRNPYVSRIIVFFGAEQDLFQDTVSIPLDKNYNPLSIKITKLNDDVIRMNINLIQCDVLYFQNFIIKSNKSVEEYWDSYSNVMGNFENKIAFTYTNSNSYFSYFYEPSTQKYEKISSLADFMPKAFIKDTTQIGFDKNHNVICSTIKGILPTPAYVENVTKNMKKINDIRYFNGGYICIIEDINSKESKFHWFSIKDDKYLGSFTSNFYDEYSKVSGNLSMNENIIKNKFGYKNEYYRISNNGLSSLNIKNSLKSNFNYNEIMEINDKYYLVGSYQNSCNPLKNNDAYLICDSTFNITYQNLTLDVSVVSNKNPTIEQKKYRPIFYRFSKLIFTYKNNSDSIINQFGLKNSFENQDLIECKYDTIILKKYSNLNLKKGQTFVDTLYNVKLKGEKYDIDNYKSLFSVTGINGFIDSQDFINCVTIIFPRSPLEVGTQDTENQQFTKVFIAENSIKVSCEKAEYFPIKLQLFDINGRLLKTSTFENNDDAIELPQGLSSGMYIANLKCSDGVQFAKKLMFTRN